MLGVGQMLGKGHEEKHKVERMRTMLASSQIMHLHPGVTLEPREVISALLHLQLPRD